MTVDIGLYIYTKMKLVLKQNTLFSFCISVFSRQQFRDAALFRHKHAACSEEEFTSGKSLSYFTIAEESTEQWVHPSFHLLPVTVVNALNFHIFLFSRQQNIIFLLH